MTTYLTIMITVMVVCEVVRIIQNTLHLRQLKKIIRSNKEFTEIWESIEELNDKYSGNEGEVK